MADIESNVKVNIDTTDALSQLKLLQQQISAFQQAMRKAGADNALAARQMQQNLANSINATGKFQANIQTIQTSAERFTGALEKNKLTMGEYFRYAGGASKTFGKLFRSEFETINQVARERVKDLQTQYIKLGRDANGAMKAIAVRPLALDMENLGTKTQMAAQRQQLFNQLMKQGSTNLLNFGKNTQWAGRQLMVGFTVPLTMMGSAAAKAYMEIEKASVAFKRVYGDINTTSEETEKMSRSVRALADEFTKYGAAVSDTMDMAAKAAAMGKTGADLLAQISQAAKLAVLGQVDQNQALETTISLTNAFGTSTEDLSGKIDFLNAVENQTVTSIEDLTIAIPKAAPVIQQLGGDVEDLTFFLTAMKEGGINASEGANALKSGLASMINPSKKASEFLASFGISVKGIVEANKGDVKGTVLGMAKAFDTLDPLNRARAIEQLFGKFQFSRISTLFQNVIKEGSQANTVAGLAKQTAEELSVLSEREMKKISDSPMYKFQKSIQDIQAKLAPVGEAFLKAVTPIIDFVSKILDGFNNLSDGTKSFITILVTAVAGIGPLLLMTFGLIANGVANIMKLFTNMKGFINKTTRPSDILGEQTGYMTTEQLKGAAIAASLDQAHAKLRQTFTSEAGAVNELTTAYRNAIQAQQAFAGVPGVPVGDPNAMTPKKYANGVSMVPGPSGAGDIVPALLSPGEAVIPARHAKKYAPVIAGMVSGNLPGFENGTTGVGMRQSVYGPMTLKQTEGLARTGVQLKDISDEVMAGPYANVPPTNFGTQISPTSGHSFPAFEVGGIYQKPDGTKVFVKPQIDLTGAMAEVRGTQIARDAHGLVAPKQEIRVMMDPTDPEGQRRFLVLESALDERIANIQNKFTNEEYFTQHVAALLRGDKDLGVGNLGGNVLADVGPAGVFGRASGKRALGSAVNSMEEQAIINLLGVKGGAKRFFAETTSEQISKLTPAEYDAAMKAEMARVAPKLQATIAGFGNMSPEEQAAYQAIQQRLQAGMGVDWGKYQVMHSGVKPKEYSEGGLVGIKNTDNFAQALRSMTREQILKNLRIQDTHLVTPLNIKDDKYLSQVQRVFPGATAEELASYEPVSNLTAQLPGNMNQVMKGNEGYDGQIFGQLWHGLTHKLSKSAKIAGISLPESQTVENEIGNRLSRLTSVTDATTSDIVGEVLGATATVTDLPLVKKQLWQLAETVGGLRSKPKKNNDGSMGEVAGEEEKTNAIVMKMLQDDAVEWNENKTGLRLKLASGAKGPRIASFNIDYFGHDDKKGVPALVEDLAARQIARDAAYGPTGWANVPTETLPELPRTLILPDDWATISKGMDRTQQKNTLVSMWRAGKLRPGTYDSAKRIVPAKNLSKLRLSKQDVESGAFSIGKDISTQAYDSSKLDKEPIAWTPGKELETYNLMSQSINGRQTIIPTTGYKFFNDLAMKMAEGGVVPGGKNPTGKPKASVFDIDDTLLDLSSFMVAHKAENEKLPEGQKKKWYKEVAKDPKGIPAGLAALKAAQQRGNKILLMTARPDFYEPYTIETLQKLGIDMNGIKLIARRDKDYRKPEQMKYDKTAAFMKYYDIEEFYDDMPKTRGAISLLGVPTYDPLKLANGVFSVPGPKGAGDVVPAMLSPGEAVIPARQAAQHRPMIQQMISGNLKGYRNGTPGIGIQGFANGGIVGYDDGGYIGDSYNEGRPLPVKIMDDFSKKKDAEALKLTELQKTAAGKVIEATKGVEENTKEAKITDKEIRDQIKAQKERAKQEEIENKRVADNQRRVDANYDQMSKKEQEKFDKNLAGKGIGAKISGAFTRNETTGKVQSAMYALTTVAGLASTIPGKVGEAAQAAMGPITAATTAMSLIPGPAGLVVGALSALVTGFMQIQAHLHAVSLESQRLSTAMGAGNSAIGKFAEFSKKATGTEVMNKQREASAGQFFNVVEGKTTFGESYMKSDSGKALVKDVGESIKSGGLDNAKKLITTQLSSAISAGVMTPAQARSIAGNLGAQLNDMKFGMDIAGDLTAITGPNGEQLEKEPLLVRMKVVEMGMENVRQQFKEGKKYEMGNEKANAGASSTTGNAIVGGVAGAAAGLAVGGIAAGVAAVVPAAVLATSALGSMTLAAAAAIPVVGWIAAGIGVVAGLVYGVVKQEEAMTKQAAMTMAAVKGQLELQQQMADSLEVSYQKRIASAKAAGDEAEAQRLQVQYLQDQKLLLQTNAKNTQEMYNTLKDASGGFLWMGDMAGKYESVANDAIDAAFKGTGQEVQATMAKDTIGNMTTANKGQKTMLKTMVASKQLGFNQVETANELFGGSAEGANQLEKLLVNSPVEANRTLGLAASLKGEQKKQFVIDMSLKNPQETKQMNDALELAQKKTGVFFGETKTQEAIMKFSVLNGEKMLEFKKDFDDLQKEKKINLSVVQRIMGPDVAKYLKDKAITKFFDKYKDNKSKVTFLAEFQQIMAMDGDPQMIASWKKWDAEQGGGTQYKDWAAWQADRTVTFNNLDATGAGDGGAKEEPKAPDPSILDPYVKMLREANNYQQKLTTGWDASFKAIMKYTSASIKQMGGFAVMMQQSGAAAEEIQAFMNGTEEEQNRIVDKKTGKLKKNAAELLLKLKQIREASEIGLKYVLMSPAEKLAKDNELYQAGLDVIGIKEKKINDKYNARVKALDEIGKIQEKNNQQQQDTMTLADALSKGDIAAAARAALTAKQNDQKAALDDAKTSVENARKLELEGIEVKINGVLTTRAEIEAKLESNAEKIAGYKLLEAQRVANIEQNALKSATHMAKLLRDGKALSLLKPYNPGTLGGTPTTKVKDKDKDDKDTGATATTAGAAIAGIAKTAKFGAGASGRVLADMKTGLIGLSSSGQKAKVADAEDARMKSGQRGQGAGFAKAVKWNKNKTVAIGWEAYDRNQIAPEKLEAYDAWVAEYANKNKAKSNIINQYEEKKTDAFNSFPPEIQTALATLKSYNEQKKAANEAVTAAQKVFDDAKIQKDKNGEYRGSPRSIVNDEKSVAAYNKVYAPLASAMATAQGLARTITGLQQSLNEKGYDMNMTEFYIGKRYAKGGMVYASNGISVEKSKYALGTDTIPAMLTPGEFVMRKSAVDSIGSGELSKMNARGKDGMSRGESVYNYSITVNANSSDANDIADSVLREIKRIDSRRIRSSNI